MQLVEQHVIDRTDPRYPIIDTAAFASKNLYNAALYVIRQKFIFEGIYLNYNKMDKLMQQHEAYRVLPAKVAQLVLEQLHEAWMSYFEQCKAYQEDPSKFTGHPKLPKYKDKVKGRNLLIYNDQAISLKALKKGYIQPSMLPIQVKTKQTRKTIDQVRIIPRKGHYVVEVVYTKQEQPVPTNPAWCAAIDLGVNNLAAIASNKPGFIPRLVNGRCMKSYNQWYNKQLKALKKKLPKEDRDRVTRQMERVTNLRNRRIYHALHTASHLIIDLMVKEQISTIIIGKNPLWKQEVKHGRHNNQNFVSIPHDRFIDMIRYKARLVGITVEVHEESYTSKASFLDLDEIPTYTPNEPNKQYKFSGKRVKRGMYRASGKRYMNSDVNGAYNILRKRRPDAFAKGVAGYVVHPVRLTVQTKQTA